MAGTPQDVKVIFAEAIGKATPQEQAAYLDTACGSDHRLRAEVESLVSAHRGAGPFLQVLLEDQEAVTGGPLTEGPGTVIGRYKLLEKIGEGGMAVVYMAEQTEPIRRTVALKIIKLGMDTRQVIARFEAERQALALMDHPNIAKVFDAGATETGRPYFVMELVQGVSITEYCDRNNLSTKDRLALFVQVCQAVQHAHQKGIIHRDIKPSNVMVTHHDGKPIPKVIDFGIAKATNQHLTEKTFFTCYGHIIGTPAYMSPEQALVGANDYSPLPDIDTRSDIYSLGVLLYELLTGTTPFSEEDLRKAGFVEMQRMIREQEPVKPSTRIRTSHVAQPPSAGGTKQPPAAAVTPGGGGATGVRSTPYQQVRGDLDWIVMKALEKDRARRYDTAGGLAEDVRRHLEHEPILARGPSTAYRLGKFLRRHRIPVGVTLATAVVAVTVGVILSMWNRDRLQLAEAEGFRQQAEGLRHKEILSQAREQYAKAERETALETVKPILDSTHIGPEARLLQAGIFADNRRTEEAVAVLNGLLNEQPAIAGAAHALLARLLWETGSPNAEKLKEIEEHRQQAEALLLGVPPSGGQDQSDPRQRGTPNAEAYFLRAMMAVSVKEQLGALDKALRLDAKHYESWRLRAFTHHASRKYDRLYEDTLVMTGLRPADPLGYSLRAVALRELGQQEEALAEYDGAMTLMPQTDPQYVNLATQRGEMLLRAGKYERAGAEAQACLKLWPDKPVFQYHLFCARTALGDVNEAQEVFRTIVRSSPTARNEFWFWATKYVFDTLEAGQSWHPGGHKPTGAAFLPLVEAEDTYRDLSAKAHRVVTNGFSAQWSPDGKKLAFSLGVQGYSGIALYDPATKETELLIVPGKDPRWSPDGRYIAFIRDCQALRLEELTAAERKDQVRWPTDEEVWVMKSDGTEPRRLARGGWPSWSRDSTCLYYQSRLDNTLCSIPIAGSKVEPKRIMACASLFPSVSPDNQRVAYLEDVSLKVKDLISQAVVAQWRVPFGTWGGPAWSPTGKELCLGAGSSVGDRTGLWIYPLDNNEPVKVLTSQIMAASWASDRTKLVFALRPPYFELWTADLDPALSTAKALGPGQMLAEHWQDMLRLYARRIETDPQDAYAYSDRARCYDALHQRAEAEADMRRWSAIVSGRLPLDLQFGTLENFRHVIHLPFDCELVFSAERPVNAIPTMSIAFGQKGRCEMKLLEIPLTVAAMFSLGALVGLDAPPAHADFTFGKPVDVKTVIPVLDSNSDGALTLSYDGLEMYFNNWDRPGRYGDADLWVIRRDSTDAPWGAVENLGPIVNAPTPAWQAAPSISADGLTLYFISDRSGGQGSMDLYMTTRATRKGPWGPPVNLGPKMNSSAFESNPWISANGRELYFQSNRPGGYGGFDIYVSRRVTTNDAWGDPANLGPVVNSAFNDTAPRLSPDGRLLFVQDWGTPRPGGYGGGDLWMTRRAALSEPWGPLVNLGPAINGAGMEAEGRITPDGSTLYFMAAGTNWQAPIIPLVDFNGDGKVDAADMGLLVGNFGKNNSLYDIGPFAWGDGVVDEQDLRVLMESLVSPKPKASDVPCDVILSWISPSFANACDVYFGTAQAAVDTADRANPQGVLVSQGQTVPTYDPPGLLEFSRTYWWRVDFVIPGPTPTIYKGPVLKFTTEAFANPIKNVTATASSSQASMGPEKTVDGSGLDKTDGHSTNGMDMWLSTAATPRWIQYQFDQVYTLHELWVWNSNQVVEPILGWGARTVKIEYSTDRTKWTQLANVPEFARATGQAGYVHNTTVSFGGVSAKYVKLTVEKNWGVAQTTGLSEVRFFYIPDRPAPKP